MNCPHYGDGLDAAAGVDVRGSAGLAAQPTVPLWLILLTVPVTLLAANLIAALPGWRAARLRPAAVLRSI